MIPVPDLGVCGVCFFFSEDRLVIFETAVCTVLGAEYVIAESVHSCRDDSCDSTVTEWLMVWG